MIGDRCSYNYGMNNDETYTPCTKCGRPMAYCKGQCCGKPKGCQCKEYGPAVCGAIRQCEPKCPYTAVIPSMVVEHVDSLKDLCDTFVHVSDINTTFYIDDKHRTIITWAGPVEYDNYDLATNSLGLRSQFLIDFANERGAYYDKTGNYKTFDFGQINDATLTVKQGDTTLGTFSANASEDVEINIPESSGEPVRLTVTYDTSEVWYRYATGADVDIDYSTMMGHRIYSFTVPSPTFHNEETGVDMTTEEVYDGLKNGEKFIFDGLPVGLSYDNNAPLGQEVTVNEAWQSLTMDNYATCNIEGAPLVDEFSGVLSTRGVFGHNVIFSLALGYGIVHTKDNDDDVYSLVVDGIEYFGSLN